MEKTKIVWVMTIDRENKTTKVVRSKKDVGEVYTAALNNSGADILSWNADVYVSFNCQMLHDLAKRIFD